MTIADNGDIVRAVGFVAIYGAYLEDRIALLTDMTKEVIPFKENIDFYSASDQANHLLKALREKFSSSPYYVSKNQDIKDIEILAEIKGYLKKRHVVIHSTLISKTRSGEVLRKNRRDVTTKPVKSKEVIDLANELFGLQSKISALKFPIRRLKQALSK